jgi:hypothetical protein
MLFGILPPLVNTQQKDIPHYAAAPATPTTAKATAGQRQHTSITRTSQQQQRYQRQQQQQQACSHLLAVLDWAGAALLNLFNNITG